MAVRFQLPFADVGDGINPSDGALLYFYATGTTTLKTTYSDESLSTANANPVVADSDGVFSDIWMDGSTRYKVVLKDKNAVQIWEADPVISGMSSADVAKVFDTVAAMVADTDLSIGGIVQTAGYTAKGDGGDNLYEIVAAATGTDDGGSYIDLATHQAKGMFYSGSVNFVQFGAELDGVVDNTVADQAAIDFCQLTGRSLKKLSGDNRTTAPLNITAPLSIIGDFPSPYIGAIGTRGKGSWFHFDHTGVGILIDGAAVMGGIFLDKFGTFRTQPSPATSWTPTAHDFDISIDNSDVIIGDLMLYNPTKGIKARNGNAGRLTIGSLRGQPLQIGLDLDQQFDAPNIGMIHFWPFWQDDTDVHTYTLANLDALYFRRVDNPFIQSLFTIFARATIRIAEAADGTVNKMRVGNMDSDRGVNGIWVDNTSVSSATAQVSNFTSQGETGVSGTKSIFTEGTGSRIDMGNVDIRVVDQNAIRLDGTSNTVRISQLFIDDFDNAATGFTAVEAAVNNVVRVDGMPTIANGGSGGNYTGAGLIYVDEWRDYTPTITTTTGTITTLGTTTGRFKRYNNTLDFEVDITITTNGTGAGVVRATTPDSITTQSQVAVGRENAISGKQLSGQLVVGTSQCDIQNYDNTYPGSDGAVIVVNGAYRIA